jgi:hypothetical protein
VKFSQILLSALLVMIIGAASHQLVLADDNCTHRCVGEKTGGHAPYPDGTLQNLHICTFAGPPPEVWFCPKQALALDADTKWDARCLDEEPSPGEKKCKCLDTEITGRLMDGSCGDEPDSCNYEDPDPDAEPVTLDTKVCANCKDHLCPDKEENEEG